MGPRSFISSKLLFLCQPSHDLHTRSKGYRLSDRIWHLNSVQSVPACLHVPPNISWAQCLRGEIWTNSVSISWIVLAKVATRSISVTSSNLPLQEPWKTPGFWSELPQHVHEDVLYASCSHLVGLWNKFTVRLLSSSCQQFGDAAGKFCTFCLISWKSVKSQHIWVKLDTQGR